MEPLVDASIDTDQIKARTDELLQAFESEWEEAPSQELDQDSMQENGVQGQFPVPPIKRRDSFGSEEQDESEQEYIACIANEEWCDDETIERRNWLEKVNLLMKSPETLETKGLVTE
jgi:hypothetical protein